MHNQNKNYSSPIKASPRHFYYAKKESSQKKRMCNNYMVNKGYLHLPNENV